MTTACRKLSRVLPLVALLLATTRPAAAGVAEDYADHVHHAYAAAHAAAEDLQQAVNRFLDDPTDARLADARKAWLDAREPYGDTEVFRFYGGPIDGVGPDAGHPEGVEGPEGRINAWPLNEAYIDAVQGQPDAGIVNDQAIAITRETLIEKNASEDEADVTTGWHAIEFLLWGQDLSTDGPGDRPASDFAKTPENERRREYLRVVTDLLVSDLASLAAQWAPDRDDNYRARFVALSDEEALTKILTGMATLSGFELASERIAVALDSGDQEDEHSCFSDNTHRDFVANQRGIVATYDAAVHPALAAKNAALDAKLAAHLRDTLDAMEAIEPPVDRILASPAGSDARKAMEAIVEKLYTQAELFIEAGKALGVEVTIAGE